jgi:hypothetical protein
VPEDNDTYLLYIKNIKPKNNLNAIYIVGIEALTIDWERPEVKIFLKLIC